MSTTIAQNIEALCQEQGIDRELVIEAVKEAVRAAAKKQFKGGEDIQVDWSSDTGLEISASKVVVDEVADPFTELSIDEARELNFPVYARGAVPMTARGRVMQESFNQEIQFAGVQCHSGDLVIADGSGVVIIPKEKENEVVAAAEAIYQKEQEMADGIRKGYSGREMLEKLGYEQMLKKQ